MLNLFTMISLLRISNTELSFIFIDENKIIKGKHILENNITSNEDNVIDINCNIIDPYISIKDNEARINLRIIDSQENLRRNDLIIKINYDV